MLQQESGHERSECLIPSLLSLYLKWLPVKNWPKDLQRKFRVYSRAYRKWYYREILADIEAFLRSPFPRQGTSTYVPKIARRIPLDRSVLLDNYRQDLERMVYFTQVRTYEDLTDEIVSDYYESISSVYLRKRFLAALRRFDAFKHPKKVAKRHAVHRQLPGRR